MGGRRRLAGEDGRLPRHGARVLMRVLALAFALAVALHAGAAPGVVVDGAAAPASTLANATTSYTVAAHTEQRNERIQGAVFTFPANTDVSGVSATTVSGQDVTNGDAITILTVVADNAAGTVIITTDHRHNQTRTDFTFTVGGVMNASRPGAYTYSVLVTTSRGSGTLTGAYALAANTSAVTVGAATLSTDTASSPAAYTVPFTVGTVGRLAGTTAAGGNTIAVTFPSGYTLPASAPSTAVTINGTASGAVSIAGNTVTITLPAGLTVPNGGAVTLVFDLTFGLVNPAAGSYTLAVTTSAQTGTGTSPAFTVASAPYLTLSVDPSTIDFGAVDPAIVSGPVAVSVQVDSSQPFTITRTSSGNAALLGLAVSGDADGAKPAGSATYVDSYTVDPPWTTDPEVALAASVQYTVVQ